MNFTRAIIISLLVLGGAVGAADSADLAGIEFFEKKIRPVLVSECYKCHSAEKKIKGELRLDWRGGWQKGGESGAAIIPGRVGKSLLIQAIRHADADLKMPPKKKLTAAQIADFEKWVAMGAPDPRTSSKSTNEEKKLNLTAARTFWAFQAVRKLPAPKVKQTDWPRTDTDRFVLSALEAKGIKPVRDADDLTLLRRIYFDLIGLPPTPAQMAAFERAAIVNRQAAIENTVDTLLASPHFGERWGRHWLDVVRFSESTGGGRTLLMKDAWRYRDYVVNAFNADKPFTEFIREQIAGDLIPGGTLEQQRERLTATAFLLLGPTNYELQDKTILEMDIVDEQLDTMGKAFMGLTIGCARCHDHKFDPIRTEDYYGMAGIFKSTKVVIHSNVSTWNKRPLPMSAKEAALAEKHAAAIGAKQKVIAALKKQLGGKTGGPVPVASLPGIVVDDLQAKLKGDWTRSTSNQGYVGANYIHDGAVGKGDKSVTYRVKIPGDGKFEVRVAYTHGTNRDAKVPVLIRHADGEVTKFIDQTKRPPIDGHFISLGTFDFLVGEWEAVVISTKGTTAHVIADAVQMLSKNAPAVAKPAPKPEGKAAQAMLKKMEAELKALQKTAVKQPQIIAADEGENPGDIQIAIRGNAHNAGPKTPRSFIRVLNRGPEPIIDAKTSGRAELANWLASANHPLTSRVFVNRVWHHLFGKGIVPSMDNFGHSGRLPTDQALLDHLAARFVDEGWSVKKLIREIVLSRVYQLSSESGDSNQEQVDIENKLHWRQNRRRLQAEAIRDAVLSVSGQLDTKSGGNTIKPGTTTEYGYQFEDTRRSLYAPVFRNTPLEILAVFDFADPNLVVGERTTSSVPTQALFLMNSPFVRTQAAAAAQRLLTEKLPNDPARIRQAYRQTLGRSPTAREREIVLKFLAHKTDPIHAWTQFFHGLYASLDFRFLN
ncbi:MAG: DUF1553 domain-containing protein [Verrucomicrobia subdivision 3 bacterium]|nr:DUF1553 domain-containing protein [Limisphaerales bacterium]